MTRANKDLDRAPKTPGAPRKPRPPYRYPAHLRNSRPRFSRCHLCGLQTLTCTYDALPLRLDPHPLSMTGEVLALSLGLRTWLLSCGNVWRRNVWCIRSSPTGTGGTIHREHRCENGHPPTGHHKKPPEASLSPDF